MTGSDAMTAIGTRRVLHVGCGSADKRKIPVPFQGDDWEEVRLDIAEEVQPDIVGDIRDMGMIADASYDALFSSHNIEHLHPFEAPRALAEFRRVLKPGTGIAVVTCPDLQSLGPLIAEGRLMETLYVSRSGAKVRPIDILYGHQASIERGHVHMAHKGGFTVRSLVDALLEAGFEQASGKRRKTRYELWAIGYRWPASRDEMLAHHETHCRIEPTKGRE